MIFDEFSLEIRKGETFHEHRLSLKRPENFTFTNDKISYIFQIMRNGQLGQLYTGARLRDREDFSHLSELGFRDMAPCVYEGDRFFSLEALRQEYPAYGTGDMRYPAYELLRENGSRLSGFVYQSHRIYPANRSFQDFRPPMWKKRTKRSPLRSL